MKLQKTLLGMRLIGLANTLRAVRYARLRDRLEKLMPSPIFSDEKIPPGSLLQAELKSGNAVFHFERATLCIRFLTPDLLFLAWDDAALLPSHAVVKTDWDGEAVELSRRGEGWKLAGSRVEIHIGENGGLEFFQQGRLLRRELPPHKETSAWSQVVALDADTSIHGLGERAAPLDLRPGAYRFWNRDSGSYSPGVDPLYITMPVYLVCSQNGSYLAFYDNTHDGTLSLGDQAEIRFVSPPVRYYLAFGSPAQAIASFAELVGKPPLPPRWALGYHHSRWGFGSEENVRRIYAGFQSRNLPLSALVLDIDHQKGYRTLTVDESKFPNLPDLSAHLAGEDVHLVSIVDPGVKQDPGYDLYRQGLQEDAFCRTAGGDHLRGVVWPGWSLFPDFSSAQVRAWWGSRYQALLKLGIHGFWHDMNEPDSFSAWGEPTFPLNTPHANDGQPADHRLIHNVYGLQMNRAGYEGLRALDPARRPFILSRSGWVGMQKHAWSWTGDLEASWEMLRQSIPTVLGLGLCGMPWSGPDIGGSYGLPEPELFVRWFQLAAFMPFFRTHSAFYLPPREPWEFGVEALDAVRRMLELRYRLLPFWYTLAWKASCDGLPLARPLFWDDPSDALLRGVEDAFLVGDSLLVAPLLHPGERRRRVFLPKGGWYSWSSGEFFDGGRQVEVEAPLDEIPLFVRSGSILPTIEDGNLHLHIYRGLPGEVCSGELYSDAGDGYGDSRVDRFKLLETGANTCTLQVETSGSYPLPYPSIHIQPHGFDGCTLEAGGMTILPERKPLT